MPTPLPPRAPRKRVAPLAAATLLSLALAACSEQPVTGVWRCDIDRIRQQVNSEIASKPAEQQTLIRILLMQQLADIEEAEWIIRDNNRYESVTGPFDNKIRSHGKWEYTRLQNGEARLIMTTTHVQGRPSTGTYQWKHEGDRLIQSGEDQLSIVLERVGDAPPPKT